MNQKKIMAQVDALLREIGTYTRNRQNSDPQDTTREGQTSIPGNQISTAHYTHLPTHTQPPAESQPIEFEPQASRWVEEQSYGWTDPLLGAYGTLTFGSQPLLKLMSS